MPTITEPSREIPVVAEVDVLVAGGGPSGIAAAVAAGRLGVQTMLVERYGCLGGLATGGLVLYMDGLFDSQGERCIGGVHWEALEHLSVLGGLAEERADRLHVDSELLQVVADRLCLQAGVTLRFHSWIVGTWTEGGRVAGVIVESKSGRQAIRCRVCVDATGDGDVAAFAGAGYDEARMRIGLNFKIGGVDLAAYRTFQECDPEGARALRAEVRALGGWPLGPGATPYSDAGVFWVNILGLATRGPEPEGAFPGFAGDLSAVDVEDLSYAQILLREQILAGIDFYRSRVPGYEHVQLLAIAPQLGVRDSRRVRGVHHLTLADAQAGVMFPDAVGMTGQTFGDGYHLQVPYRALVPETVDGLLTGGRCISVDDVLIHPLRIIPPCMMTGQAAGTAAALAARQGIPPRALEVGPLRAQLQADGVLLP